MYNRIRKKYSIPSNAKVVLYVGNISKNKNQLQIVEAFALLPEDVIENTWVLFCGAETDSSVDLTNVISAVPHSDHLVLCGGIPKEEISEYYNAADAVALLSISEGFGLSLIEGMHFGLPCMMFADMDAFEDIYDPCAVIPIMERDTASVVTAMLSLLGRSWDATQIKSYSERFGNNVMAQKYLEIYKTV